MLAFPSPTLIVRPTSPPPFGPTRTTFPVDVNTPVEVLIGLPSVPEVILLALKSGMSDAAKLNLSDETVPLARLLAFKLVRPDPLPDTEVVVRAPTFEVPWTSKVYPGLVVPMPTSPDVVTTKLYEELLLSPPLVPL